MKSDNQTGSGNKTESVVACIKGDDKYKVLQKIIEQNGKSL